MPAGIDHVNVRATQRLDRVARVLWGHLGMNPGVTLARLLHGWRSGAIAMAADGIHSLLDTSSNIIALVGVTVARWPSDANHPQGHRKCEAFEALESERASFSEGGGLRAED
jgi:divalent metal cation (Fe/Co/Zn/Cd) transporter